jgi:acetyl-CoA carboxylase/biotin carboxylase 1
MEFYAAEDARGGVLEAAGAVSIKFRDRDLKAAAHRLDHELIAMDAKLAALKSNLDNTESIDELNKNILHRERILLGVYQQVAVHFADLHDTPGRMKRKGVIRRQVQWSESRSFFYWRLRRKLLEFELAKSVEKMKHPAEATLHRATLAGNAARGSVSSWSSGIINDRHNKTAASAMLRNLFVASGSGSSDEWDEDDQKALKWLIDNQSCIKDKLFQIRRASIIDSLSHTVQSLNEASEIFQSKVVVTNDDQTSEGNFVADILMKSIPNLSISDAETIANILKKSKV